jgi:uncharacterized protein (DUF934 family)
MPTLLRQGRIVDDDPWHLVEDNAEPGPDNAAIIVSWARWRSLIDAGRPIERTGVWIAVDQEPDELRDALDRLPLVAIRFPALNDGRGLSLAVLLRTRHGYRGELRAIGAVHEDLTRYLLRCGFDSLLLADGRDVETALRASALDGPYYQGSVVEPRPAFRRLRRGA